MIKKTAQYLSLVHYGIKIIVRSFVYSILFKAYGKKTIIAGRITVIRPERISIGSYSTLNEGVFLNGQGGITIGSHVHISPNVNINTAELDLNCFSKKNHRIKPILIEDHVWICSGAIINPGVIIGKMSVVGAGAVVTKNVPPFTVVTGIPARPNSKIKIKA